MASSSQSDSQSYDAVRRSWVKSTPEERVRQRWLRHLVQKLHFPKELIVVEKELKELPHLREQPVPSRRVDILCYAKGVHPDHTLYPLLLIECKPVVLNRAAIDQVIGYNGVVGACFVAVANDREIQVGYFHREMQKYVFGSGLPHYQELIEWIKR